MKWTAVGNIDILSVHWAARFQISGAKILNSRAPQMINDVSRLTRTLELKQMLSKGRGAWSLADDPATDASECCRIENSDGLAGLQAEWIALRARVDGVTFYQSFEWCAAWVEACRTAGCREEVRVVTLRHQGRLVLVWPLAAIRRGSVTILQALAAPATQYCDALVEDHPRAPAWMDSAWRAVLSQSGVDLVRLRKVRADSAVERLGRPWLHQHEQSRAEAPSLSLIGAGGVSDVRRSGRSLNALRRHLKNLGKHGTVTFEVASASDHAATLREAFRLKHEWSRQRGLISAGYSHAANEGAMLSVAERGLFTARRLMVAGRLAALEIGVIDRGHYYSMIQSYDLGLAQHAPGRLLLWKMLEAGDHGISTFDFLPPSQPHKTEWTEQSVAVHDYAVARTLRGQIYLSMSRRLKPALKRAQGRIPTRFKLPLILLLDRCLGTARRTG